MESTIQTLTTNIPRPTFMALMALISGIIATHALGLINSIPFLITIVLVVILGLLIRYPQARLLFLLLLFFCVGGAEQSLWNSRQHSAIQVRDHIITSGISIVQIHGELQKPSRSPRVGNSFWLKAGSTIAGGGEVFQSSVPILVYAFQLENSKRWEYGDEIEFVGQITPLSINQSPRDFDRYFTAQGAVLVAEADHITAYQKNPNLLDKMLNTFGSLGDDIEQRIELNVPEKEAGFIIAASLGRTASLDDDIYEEARRSGIAHIFAVSGLHTGIIGIFLIGIARLLGLRPHWSTLFVFFGLFCFIAIIGFRPSAIRAAILVLVYSGQFLFHRQVDGLASLSSVALLFLLFDTSLLFRMDFQLSFLCAAVIFLIMPGFAKWQEELLMQWREKNGWSKIPTFISNLVTIFICSCFIQLTLSPLMLSQMGMASIVSPISNLVALTLVPFLVAGTFLASLASAIWAPLASVPFGFVEFISTIILWWSHVTSSIPFATYDSPFTWPAWLVAAYYLIISMGTWIRLRPQFSVSQHTIGTSLQLMAPFLFILITILFFQYSPRHQVTFLDIGQGDAILIEDGRKRVLVDTGPPSGTVLLRELHAVGIRELDLVILTHADSDHIGGFSELVNNVSIKEVWINNQETLEAIAPLIQKKNVIVSFAEKGTELIISNQSKIQILHPSTDYIPADPRNDSSIALVYSYGEIDVLLTGDLEDDGESAMLQSSSENLIDIEIFKAGHHGSSSSTTERLLDHLQPEIVIVSCGLYNRYGHPKEDVLERVESAGARVYRTDWMGRVKIVLSSDHFNIEPERPIGIPAP